MSGPVFYCAPLEGLTSFVFRRAHARLYPGVTKYFSPFLSPAGKAVFSKREKREAAPENNAGLTLVPQLLARDPEAFICGARELMSLGYDEVNLNLGCPSGTVVSKGKGSGFLQYPDELDAFLERVYSAVDCRVSIKTRLGLTDPEEFFRLLEIYNRYPVHELIIHPRVRTDYYREPVREEFYVWAFEHSRAPVCLNGDMWNVSGIERRKSAFPEAKAIMLGRGLCADPALVQKELGTYSPDRERLLEFHDEIFRGYTEAFGSPRSAMARMKELWSYLIHLFEDGEKYAKQIKKSTEPAEYEVLAHDAILRLAMVDEVEARL